MLSLWEMRVASEQTRKTVQTRGVQRASKRGIALTACLLDDCTSISDEWTQVRDKVGNFVQLTRARTDESLLHRLAVFHGWLRAFTAIGGNQPTSPCRSRSDSDCTCYELRTTGFRGTQLRASVQGWEGEWVVMFTRLARGVCRRQMITNKIHIRARSRAPLCASALRTAR